MHSIRAKWLLFVHRVPSKPDYLRVKVGRQLRTIGAVAIKNSIYVAQATSAMQAAFAGTAKEIQRRGGDAMLCEARFIEGLTDGAVEDLFRAASDAEYAEIASAAAWLASGLRGRRTDDARRRRAGRGLDRLRARFEEAVARDPFGAGGRNTAARALSLAEDRVQGVELAASDPLGSAEPPRGATWVTRTGVMVDRIASAWLIRRFIDTTASFKFVPARGYRPARGDIRYDMADAEFTHRDGRCTFEVLLEHFRLRESGLRAIAEIVHDLDLEDDKYRRAETAGVGRMIVGLAISNQEDTDRIAHGAPLFDSLFESFRKGSR